MKKGADSTGKVMHLERLSPSLTKAVARRCYSAKWAYFTWRQSVSDADYSVTRSQISRNVFETE